MPETQGSMVFGTVGVKMEVFGNVTSFFGPLGPPVSGNHENEIAMKVSSKSTRFADKVYKYSVKPYNFQIQHTLMAPWFHGELDSVEAAKILRASGYTCSFLVRFSAREPGCFTLSRSVSTTKGEEIQHHRLYNASKGIAFGSNVFPTVGAFIKRAAGPLQLVNPVQPTPYQHLIKLWASKLQHLEEPGSKKGSGIYMRVRSAQPQVKLSISDKNQKSKPKKSSFTEGEADSEARRAAASKEHVGRTIAEMERNTFTPGEKHSRRTLSADSSHIPPTPQPTPVPTVKINKRDISLPSIKGNP